MIKHTYRLSIQLVFVIAALSAFTGCSSSSSGGGSVSLTDAKAAFAAVMVGLNYGNPSNWPASYTGSTTITSPNDQTYTSPDGKFTWHLTALETNFSTYPNHRTYTLTFTNFTAGTSGYTMTGTATEQILFPSSGFDGTDGYEPQCKFYA